MSFSPFTPSRSQIHPSFYNQVSSDPMPFIPEEYSSDSLHAAAFSGEINSLQAWTLKNPDRLLDINSKGESLWFSAIRGNQLEVLKWLHTKDPGALNQTDENRSTLMHFTCTLGNLSIAQWIFQQEPDLLTTFNKDQLTPLHLASFNEHLCIVEYFFSHFFVDILFQCSMRPCPKTLAFLLDKEIRISTNPIKQTLLHLAAQSAQEENIRLFIERNKFDINARDLEGRTPLFLAVLQGHQAIVKLLILAGANAEICSNEQENILSVAAFYNHTMIVQDLLAHPSKHFLLSSKDSDGKTALHKAVWGDPKPEIIRLLLENGADPHCMNDYNYTPLHWAAKHGHKESAKILMQYGADLDCMNSNHDTPLDLAINWGQDHIVHLFLETSNELLIENHSQEKLNSADLERYYSQSLMHSKKENLTREQLFYLEKLSGLFIKKGNFLTAAKILNCALAILENNPPFENTPIFVRYFLGKLERIEGLFLESQSIKTHAENRHYLEAERGSLNALRANLKRKFDEKETVPLLLQQLTVNFREILQRLILSAQESLGPSPAKWACMGMGSMARDEMCPYSDLEFAFVTENESFATLQYFRLLTQMIELKIVNMGETRFSIFGDCEPSPTRSGFSLDIGGNTPFGNRLTYELIGTPQSLARFQKQELIDENIIVSNAIGTVCFIAGDEKLVKNYRKEKNKILDEKKGFFGEPHRKSFAIELIKGHLKEFKPDLSETKEKLKAFGIKAELYRPFQEIISCLALFYDLKSTNTLERVNELLKIGVFCAEGAKSLRIALAYVLHLRLQAHLFYQDEKEIVCHIEEGKPQESTLLYFDEEKKNIIRRVYMALIPFCESFKFFCLTKKRKTLNTCHFFESSIVNAQQIFYAHSSDVLLASQQALSLNPRNVQALLDFANITIEYGNPEEGLIRAQQALQIAQEMYGEMNAYCALSNLTIGDAFSDLEKYREALDRFEQGLSIFLIIEKKEPDAIAISYSKFAGAQFHLGQYDESLEYYHRALAIFLEFNEGQNYSIISVYTGIAMVLEVLGKGEEAWEFHVKATTLALKLKYSRDIGISGNSNARGISHECAGDFLINTGNLQESVDHYLIALQYHMSRFNSFNKVHPIIGRTYKKISDVFKITKQYDKSLEYQHTALQVYSRIYDEYHPKITQIYGEIGTSHFCLEQYLEALEFFQKTLNGYLKISFRIGIASTLFNIGFSFFRLEKYKESLEYFQNALNIELEIYGEEDSKVAMSRQLIDLALNKLLH